MVARCNFRGAKIAPKELASAKRWEQAELDDQLRAQTQEASVVAILEGSPGEFLSPIIGNFPKYSISSTSRFFTFRGGNGIYQFITHITLIQFFNSLKQVKEFPFDAKLATAISLKLATFQKNIKRGSPHDHFVRDTRNWLTPRHARRGRFHNKPSNEQKNSAQEITEDTIKPLLDKLFVPDGRMTKLSYWSAANTAKKLGFNNIGQLQIAIIGQDDREISRAANGGGISGQCYRLEEVLLMQMGKKYIDRLYPPDTDYNFMREIAGKKLKSIEAAGFRAGTYSNI